MAGCQSQSTWKMIVWHISSRYTSKALYFRTKLTWSSQFYTHDNDEMPLIRNIGDNVGEKFCYIDTLLEREEDG